MTPAEFKILQPEFSTAPDTTVQGCLDAAERRTPVSKWGEYQADGIRWLTAHLLSLGPMGMNARKALVDGTTVYDMERQRLVRMIGGGPRTT